MINIYNKSNSKETTGDHLFAIAGKHNTYPGTGCEQHQGDERMWQWQGLQQHRRWHFPIPSLPMAKLPSFSWLYQPLASFPPCSQRFSFCRPCKKKWDGPSCADERVLYWPTGDVQHVNSLRLISYCGIFGTIKKCQLLLALLLE